MTFISRDWFLSEKDDYVLNVAPKLGYKSYTIPAYGPQSYDDEFWKGTPMIVGWTVVDNEK